MGYTGIYGARKDYFHHNFTLHLCLFLKPLNHKEVFMLQKTRIFALIAAIAITQLSPVHCITTPTTPMLLKGVAASGVMGAFLLNGYLFGYRENVAQAAYSNKIVAALHKANERFAQEKPVQSCGCQKSFLLNLVAQELDIIEKDDYHGMTHKARETITNRLVWNTHVTPNTTLHSETATCEKALLDTINGIASEYEKNAQRLLKSRFNGTFLCGIIGACFLSKY